MNYEQILQAAKDEVARKYGHDNWYDMTMYHFNEDLPLMFTDRIDEVALLAMQRVAEAHQDLLIRLQDYMNDKADVVDVEGSITPVANIEMNFSTEIESLIKL